MTRNDSNLTSEVTPNVCQAHCQVLAKYRTGETQGAEVEGLSEKSGHRTVCRHLSSNLDVKTDHRQDSWARDVIEDEIVAGQKFSPTGLTMVQDFDRHEDFQVLVIRANSDRILRSFEVVTPVLEAFDNGEHFSVMDIVIAFLRNALSEPKCNRI